MHIITDMASRGLYEYFYPPLVFGLSLNTLSQNYNLSNLYGYFVNDNTWPILAPLFHGDSVSMNTRVAMRIIIENERTEKKPAQTWVKFLFIMAIEKDDLLDQKTKIWLLLTASYFVSLQQKKLSMLYLLYLPKTSFQTEQRSTSVLSVLIFPR